MGGQDSIHGLRAGHGPETGNWSRTSSTNSYAFWLICFSEMASTWLKSRWNAACTPRSRWIDFKWSALKITNAAAGNTTASSRVSINRVRSFRGRFSLHWVWWFVTLNNIVRPPETGVNSG